jgi:hypothetical protein
MQARRRDARRLKLLVCASIIAALARARADLWDGGALRLRGGARGLNRGAFEELERAAEEQTKALEAVQPDAAARWRALQEKWNERAKALGVKGMPADERTEMFDPDIPIRRDVMEFLLDGPYVRYVRRSLRPHRAGRGPANRYETIVILLACLI